MSWTTPKTWVTDEILTSDDLNTYLRDNMTQATPNLAEHMAGYFVSSDVNAIAERESIQKHVNKEFQTTSTTFVESDDGPYTRFEHGGQFLAIFACRISATSGGTATCSVGSSEQPAQGKYGVRSSEDMTAFFRGKSHRWFTGETPGETRVSMQYLTSAGTASFAQRVLIVLPF